MGEKSDLSDSECGMVISTKGAGIFQNNQEGVVF